MSSIDDLLDDAYDKSRVVDRARISTKAILFSLPEGEDYGNWVITWHGISRGDLAYAIACLQAEFTRSTLEASDDE